MSKNFENYECDGQMSIFDYIKKPAEKPKEMPRWFKPEDGWRPIGKTIEKSEGISKYDKLEICGIYKLFDEFRYSVCPAYFDGQEVIAQDVPFDIPRPKWMYWRLKEKVYEVGQIGICDDPICSNCDYEFSMFDSKWSKNEIDIERCPNCGVRLDWERWHRVNDNE